MESLNICRRQYLRQKSATRDCLSHTVNIFLDGLIFIISCGILNKFTDCQKSKSEQSIKIVFCNTQFDTTFFHVLSLSVKYTTLCHFLSLLSNRHMQKEIIDKCVIEERMFIVSSYHSLYFHI